MRSKSYFRSLLLGAGIALLSSCAAWHSGQKDNNSAMVDGESYASNVQTTGLGDDSNVRGSADQELTKRTYYFAYDKSDVRQDDLSALEANAKYLIDHPDAKALIEGHTDPRGSREYNIALGERRSKAIENILREHGVKPSQIRIISYGSEKLASNGRTETDYQLDRRGILVYLQQ